MEKGLSLVLFLVALTTLLVACTHVSGEKNEAKQYLVNDKEYQLAKFCIYASHGGLRRLLKRFENEQVRDTALRLQGRRLSNRHGGDSRIYKR